MERNQRKTPFLLGKLGARGPSPIRTGHQDGTLGPLEDREGGDRDMSQQNIPNSGDHRVGLKKGETGEL